MESSWLQTGLLNALLETPLFVLKITVHNNKIQWAISITVTMDRMQFWERQAYLVIRLLSLRLFRRRCLKEQCGSRFMHKDIILMVMNVVIIMQVMIMVITTDGMVMRKVRVDFVLLLLLFQLLLLLLVLPLFPWLLSQLMSVLLPQSRTMINTHRLKVPQLNHSSVLAQASSRYGEDAINACLNKCLFYCRRDNGIPLFVHNDLC